MGMILPDVGSTVGPTWATELNTAFSSILDSHDHSTGKGVKITPAGLNISSDLTFNLNNATGLRTARLNNYSAFTPGINDLAAIYALNNELYYRDGAGNAVQITSGGAVNIAGSVTTLTINDANFTLQYFGDTTRKFRFDGSNIPASTTRIFSLPEPGSNDTLLSNNSTSVVTNKTFKASTTIIADATDTSKALQFALSSATTLKTLTLSSAHTNNRTITFPDTTDTLAVLGTNQTFTATQSINALMQMQSGNAIRFFNSTNTFYSALKGGVTTANVTWNLPIADGTSGQLMKTDGGGNLGWATAAAYSRGDVATAATIAALSSASSLIRLTGSTATSLQGIAAGSPGQLLVLYNVSTALITVTNQNASASAANRIITASGQSVYLQSGWSGTFYYDDSQSRWILTGTSCVAEWTAYTPTFTNLGTTSNASAFYKIVGDSVYVRGSVTCGTVATALATISLPSVFTINSTKLSLSSSTTANNCNILGTGASSASTLAFNILAAPGTSTSVVYNGSLYSSGNALAPANASSTITNSGIYSFYFEFPI